MNKIFLLIDFGASRIKSAIFDSKKLNNIKNFTPTKPYDTKNNKYVVSLNEIEKQFRTIVSEYSLEYKIDGIYLCSEMHGFAILNEENKPISDYISWKDERCLNKKGGISTFEYLKKIYGETFYKKTGMKPRPCYPFFNLFEYLQEKKLFPQKIKIISLPEWICALDGQSKNISHSTMSAGLGFYNIYTKQFDKELISAFDDFNLDILFNKPTDNIEIGGYININGKNIPIYTGVGDHQCAVLGAGNDENTISLNLGTGSQIGVINSENNTAEKRPFFDNKLLSVITHIPSGRSFNTYINFLTEINPNYNYWEMLSNLSLQDVLNSTLEIDLANFSSAWNYENGGKISKINETNLNLKNFLGSILKNYILQYEKGIEYLGEKRKKIILSGVIPHKLPIIKEYFEKKGYETLITTSQEDETFLGLCIIISKNC